MLKCARLGLFKDAPYTQSMKLFLVKRQMSEEEQLARNNKIRNRAVWSKQIEVLIKKRDNLQRMSLDIQKEQSETEAKLRLNKQQLQEATDEWNKLKKDP